MPVAEPIAEARDLALLGQGDYQWGIPADEPVDAEEVEGEEVEEEAEPADDESDTALDIPAARRPDRLGELARLSTWWTEVRRLDLNAALAILGVESLEEVTDPKAARAQLEAALLLSSR